MGVIHFFKSDYDNSILYYSKSLKIKEELKDKKGTAKALNDIGLILKDQGSYPKAIDNFSKSLTIYKEMGNKQGGAKSLVYLGHVYNALGDYDKATICYSQSLSIGEKIDDKKGQAIALNGLGNVSSIQLDIDNAILYYSKSLILVEELGDDKKIAVALNNLGNIYSNQKDYSQALKYFTASLKINEKNGKKIAIANSLHNLGNLYFDQENFEEAITNYTKSLSIREEIGDQQGIAASLSDMGSVYLRMGDYVKALQYSRRSLQVAQNIGAAIEIQNAARLLWEIAKELEMYRESLEMHELFIATRDSILSEENQNEIIRQGYKYEYEQEKALDNAEHEKQSAVEKQEKEKQKIITYGISTGLVLVVVFLIFVFNRLRTTKKQKSIIEKQKDKVESQKEVIEETHKEITDSINYAKRIQTAILPSDKMVSEALQEHFILYLPKAIVAGDFYWVREVEDYVYFAAADCTGHGVPGALVSVICSNALNRSIEEFTLREPGEILDKTTDLLIDAFIQSNQEVKDGMDISLCRLNKLTNQISFAGANNPLYIVKAKKENMFIDEALIQNDKNYLVEIKGNKQPIGLYDNRVPFKTHEVKVEEGDMIYSFTDGFPDQFGGERGKKYKYKQFKNYLLSISNASSIEQHKLLLKEFQNWMNVLEQVDDVCIIGYKVK